MSDNMDTPGKKTFYNFETDSQEMVIVLKAESMGLATRMQSEVVNMVASGMSREEVKAALWKDLNEGGKLFGGLRNAFRSVTGSILEDISQGAIFQKYGEDDNWEWITTSGNPCVDCNPRHGQVKTYTEWRDLGLPRSGFSVCDMHCKCVLVPQSKVAKDFGEPVKVKTLAEAREEFQKKLETDTELQDKLSEYKAYRRLKNKPEELAKYRKDPGYKKQIDDDIKKRSEARKSKSGLTYQGDLRESETVTKTEENAIKTITDFNNQAKEKVPELGNVKSVKVGGGADEVFMQSFMDGRILINNKTTKDGFNPLQNLSNALGKIEKRKTLLFDEEYAIEAFWHEVLHLKLKENLNKTFYLYEAIHQFYARMTYDKLLAGYGATASKKEIVLKEGYGYKESVNGFLKFLDEIEISPEKAVGIIEKQINTTGKITAKRLLKDLSKLSGTDRKTLNQKFSFLSNNSRR